MNNNEISPEDTQVLETFFQLKDQKKFDEALEVLIPLKAKYITNHTILFLIGSTQYSAEHFEAAKTNLCEAISINPEHMLTSLILVHTLSELGKWHTTFEEIRRYLSTKAESKGEHKALIREMLEGIDSFSASEKEEIKKLGAEFLRKPKSL